MDSSFTQDTYVHALIIAYRFVSEFEQGHHSPRTSSKKVNKASEKHQQTKLPTEPRRARAYYAGKEKRNRGHDRGVQT